MARAVVRGDRRLSSNLRSIGAAFTAAEMDEICRKTLAPMRDRAEVNALALRDFTHTPPGGHLDEGIVIVKQKSSAGFREFWISFTRRARKLAHLVEFGTAPHWQPHRFGGWMHPGARPKPFFRPAFEAEKNSALGLFAALAWGVIARRAAALPKDD